MRLSLPNVKENFGKRTFLFTGEKFFNKLPLNIAKSETFRRSAAEQDISFYQNFDILLYFKVSVNENFSTLLDFVFFGFLA